MHIFIVYKTGRDSANGQGGIKLKPRCSGKYFMLGFFRLEGNSMFQSVDAVISRLGGEKYISEYEPAL